MKVSAAFPSQAAAPLRPISFFSRSFRSRNGNPVKSSPSTPADRKQVAVLGDRARMVGAKYAVPRLATLGLSSRRTSIRPEVLDPGPDSSVTTIASAIAQYRPLAGSAVPALPLRAWLSKQQLRVPATGLGKRGSLLPRSVARALFRNHSIRGGNSPHFA